MKTVVISFAVSAATTIALALLAEWLFRRHGFKLPGVSIAETPHEKLNAGLSGINQMEMVAGREPFTLTRRVQGARS